MTPRGFLCWFSQAFVCELETLIFRIWRPLCRRCFLLRAAWSLFLGREEMRVEQAVRGDVLVPPARTRPGRGRLTGPNRVLAVVAHVHAPRQVRQQRRKARRARLSERQPVLLAGGD